jgi:2-amino-4-hydroxy-6-hydroxymethyldihydropteridine diphosphokinase
VAARRCYLGLGSNLGNRPANLRDALRRLGSAVQVDGVSALYESEPVGPSDQAPYLNAACTGVTSIEPLDLLDEVKRVEWAMGRRPGPRWGPRPLDIDILMIEGVAVTMGGLEIPHPRMAERPFVLRPLADLDPSLLLPDGRTAGAAADRLSDTGLRRIAGQDWPSRLTVMPPAMRPAIAGT